MSEEEDSFDSRSSYTKINDNAKIILINYPSINIFIFFISKQAILL